MNVCTPTRAHTRSSVHNIHYTETDVLFTYVWTTLKSFHSILFHSIYALHLFARTSHWTHLTRNIHQLIHFQHFISFHVHILIHDSIQLFRKIVTLNAITNTHLQQTHSLTHMHTHTHTIKLTTFPFNIDSDQTTNRKETIEEKKIDRNQKLIQFKFKNLV